jgi:hypothetical protein
LRRRFGWVGAGDWSSEERDGVEVGEADHPRGGAAAGFEGSLALLGRAPLVRGRGGVGLDLLAGVGEDVGEAAEGLRHDAGRDEADSSGGDVVDVLEALGDVGAGDPEGEGFERGLVFGGDFKEGGGGIGESGDDGRGDGLWWAEGCGLRVHVWGMYSGARQLSIGF